MFRKKSQEEERGCYKVLKSYLEHSVVLNSCPNTESCLWHFKWLEANQIQKFNFIEMRMLSNDTKCK